MDRLDPTSTQSTATRKRRGFPLGALLAVLGVALLTALVWYLTKKPDTQAAAPGAPAAQSGAPAARPPGGGGRGAPATVAVARAQKADIPVQIDALGTITPPATATVRAQVSGVLQKIHFTEGQTVKQGQLLAEVDPRPYEMALMQATGQRQRDEAQLENARVQLKRFQTLLEQDSIARQEVDTQAALVKQLEGTVMTDRAAEGTARINLGYTRVTAPIAGKVGLRAVDLGNVVGPGDANGLVAITQVAPIDAVFSIPQDQLAAVRQKLAAGEQLKVTAWDRGRTRMLATGRFLALDNQIDTQTGTARAKGRFSNEEMTLFPGQFVNIRLQLGSLADSVTIPVSALRHGSNGDYVFVLNPEQKTVSVRNVQAGQFVDDKVQIISGLAADMQVITEGADRLRDGSTVNLPGERGERGTGGERGMRGQRGQGGPNAGQGKSQTGAQGGAPNAAADAKNGASAQPPGTQAPAQQPAKQPAQPRAAQ